MDSDVSVSARALELLQELVRVCRSYSDSVSLFPEPVTSESGELLPPLRRAAAQTVPMLQLYQEKRHLLVASPHPDKLIERIEHLKDFGVHAIDPFLWLVSQILFDPNLKKLVTRDASIETSAMSDCSELKAIDDEALVEGILLHPRGPYHQLGSEQLHYLPGHRKLPARSKRTG